MKRHLKVALGVLAAAALAVTITACSGNWWVTIGVTPSSPEISGKIVNARTGSGMDITGATVTLVNVSTGKSYPATSTDSSGNWSVLTLDSGAYNIQVSESGYFFTSFIEPFTFSSASAPVTAPTIAGVTPSSLTGNVNVAFVLMWETNQELDMHMTFPDPAITWQSSPGNYSDPAAYPYFFLDSPSYEPAGDQDVASFWGQGFGPNGGYAGKGTTFSRSGRIEIAPSTPVNGQTTQTKFTDTSGNDVVTLDNTATAYGPTTITVLNAITYPSTFDMPIAGQGGTPSDSYPYNLMDTTLAPAVFKGVAELYVDASATSTTSSISAAGSNSNAVLYIVGKSSAGSAVLLGKITIPTDILVKTTSVARINITDQEYQIVPDIALQSPGTYKSLGSIGSGKVINVPIRGISGQ